MKMRANYILVDPESWPQAKIGSIVLPQTDKGKTFARGTVMEVGPGLFLPNGERPPIEAKPGDHVLYFKASAAGIIVQGKEMHIIQEREMLAVLESNDFNEIKTEGESDASD